MNGNGRRTFDGWIATVKSMEFTVAMTVKKLEKGEAYKTKNKDSLQIPLKTIVTVFAIVIAVVIVFVNVFIA